MKPLPEAFVSKGHRHELVNRTGEGYARHFAIYKRWSIATEYDTPTPHFEVIRIGNQEAGVRDIGGQTVVYEEKETYPTERTWASDGWTFQSLARAEKKYEALAKRARMKSIHTDSMPLAHGKNGLSLRGTKSRGKNNV